MHRSKVWPFLVLIIIGSILYGHYLNFALLPYDDNYNIYENKHLLSGDWLYFWKNSYVNLYIPVPYTLWTWTYQLAGASSTAFHSLNVFFHLINGVLIYLILSKFSFSRPAALVGSLFFLVHPLQVEAVAWATSFRDTLAFFFVLLSVGLSIFYPQKKVATVFFFFLALLSKPSAVAVPVLLAFIIFIRTGSTGLGAKLKSIIKSNLPLVAAFAGILPVIFISKRDQAAEIQLDSVVTFGQRIIIVLDAVGFYLQKILLPLHLYSDYGRSPRWIIENADWYLNVSVAIIFFGLLFYFIKTKRPDATKNDGFLFWFFLAFAVTLYLPVSGVVSFGYQSHSTTADRYMYPVLFSMAALVAWGYEQFDKQNKKAILKVMASLYLIILTVTGYTQSLNWKDTASFYKFSYEGTPHSYKIVQNVAVAYQKEGSFDKSMEFFYKANQLDPQKLPPIAGIVSNLYNQKRFSELDEFGKKFLSLEKLKQMSPSADSSVVIYQAYAMAHLERGNPKKALPILCVADEVVTKPNVSFKNLLESTRGQVDAKDQYCPPSLLQADKELF